MRTAHVVVGNNSGIYRNKIREEVIPEDMVHDVNMRREELIGNSFF